MVWVHKDSQMDKLMLDITRKTDPMDKAILLDDGYYYKGYFSNSIRHG